MTTSTTDTQGPAPDVLADALQAARYITTCLTEMRKKRGDTLPTPDAGTDHDALVVAATEVLRLIEMGPRAVRCNTCGAAAGISCTLGLSLEYGQCHTERRLSVQADARTILRRALGLPPHGALASQPSATANPAEAPPELLPATTSPTAADA